MFKCVPARHAARRLAPAAANGANEAAVALFLDHRISFTDIGSLVTDAVENQPDAPGSVSVDDILEADAAARRHVLDSAGLLR